MTGNEQHDQLDRLVQRSFEQPIPTDTRDALQRELAAVREAWRTGVEMPRPVLALHGAFRGPIRLAAAACLLAAVSIGTRLALHHRAAGKAAPRPVYACAVAHRPASFARCTAVFYSKQDPTVWVERRMVVFGQQGHPAMAVAYNQKGAR